MKPPIIVSEKGDLTFFREVADVEAYLEPIDVENEEYVAFDSLGHRLILEVATGERKLLAGFLRFPVKSVAVKDRSEEPQEEVLRRILAGFLGRVGEEESRLASLTVAELVDLGIRHAGYS